MGGIRSKVEECAYIRKLFDNLGLKVDERDIFMHRDYQSQLDMRLASQNASVPHVFVNGVSLGVRSCKVHVAGKEPPTSLVPQYCQILLMTGRGLVSLFHKVLNPCFHILCIYLQFRRKLGITWELSTRFSSFL